MVNLSPKQAAGLLAYCMGPSRPGTPGRTASASSSPTVSCWCGAAVRSVPAQQAGHEHRGRISDCCSSAAPIVPRRPGCSAKSSANHLGDPRNRIPRRSALDHCRAATATGRRPRRRLTRLAHRCRGRARLLQRCDGREQLRSSRPQGRYSHISGEGPHLRWCATCAPGFNECRARVFS